MDLQVGIDARVQTTEPFNLLLQGKILVDGVQLRLGRRGADEAEFFKKHKL